MSAMILAIQMFFALGFAFQQFTEDGSWLAGAFGVALGLGSPVLVIASWLGGRNANETAGERVAQAEWTATVAGVSLLFLTFALFVITWVATSH